MKASRLGFRTLALSKEWGGHGVDLVTQVLVMAELAKADSAISKTFSQCWKWSHLISAVCTQDQKERFLKSFLKDDTYLLGSGKTRAARRIRSPVRPVQCAERGAPGRFWSALPIRGAEQ